MFQLTHLSGKFFSPSQPFPLQREFIRPHNASALAQVLLWSIRQTQATAPGSMPDEVQEGSWDLLTPFHL